MSTLTITDYFRPFQGNPYYRLDLSGLGLDSAELAVLIGQLTPEQKTQVRKLNLFKNQISDLSSIAVLKGLERLVFSNNQVSDLGSISGLKSLEYLNFANNQISDLGALESLTDLEWLDVTGNPIEDYSPLDNLPDCRIYR
jgi:Leucine-rich repeat (LRR) protein